MEQKIITSKNGYVELDEYIQALKEKKIFLVCDDAIKFLELNDYFLSMNHRLGTDVVRFSDFCPNPLYESVVEGVKKFKTSGANTIIAVGGGSAIDVAKCIKLYSNMDDGQNYLDQKIVPNDINFLAVPTTAGTGSEATRYAVIYYDGKKQSVTDESCIPDTVLMDASVLKTLPEYQKKSTMLDAFCHAVESYWSVNSTGVSKEYSRNAIRLIMTNINGYLANEENANAQMLRAANMAGKAINITQTTAGHAMCYKLTGLYGIAHGHAAALCVRKLWPWMIAHTDKCRDIRGERYLRDVFDEIADVMECDDGMSACKKFDGIFQTLRLSVPKATGQDYEILRTSVNVVRLKNNPVELSKDIIDILYHEILNHSL